MEKELERILYNIKQKTGIGCDLTSINGVISASSNEVYTPITNVDFAKTYQSEDENRTYFKFIFQKTEFVGAITGCNEVYKNYAELISSIIENSQVAEGEQSYETQFLSIVTGDTTRSRTERFLEKYSICKSNCYAIIFKSEGNTAVELTDFLNSYSTNGQDTAVSIDNCTSVYVRFIENEVDYEYHSATDFANLVIQASYEELGLKLSAYIGGKVKSFSEVCVSYEQALASMRLSKSFGLSGAVHAYKDFTLVKIIEDLPNAKMKEFLNVILDENGKQIFLDDEIIETAEEFLNNNLNISETARVLYVHRNTLMYRIDKIERTIGLDIRKFGDALTFRIISVLYKLLNN
ncbi:MAG: helix-turn-helix domain-containing protein [Clostridia bacterium]|nr:helix-turn-helix domain-containing protein [Clostridia bacterium]